MGLWGSALLDGAEPSGMELALAPGHPVFADGAGARNPRVTIPH